MNALKNSFKNEGIENAFSEELLTFLKEIDRRRCSFKLYKIL